MRADNVTEHIRLISWEEADRMQSSDAAGLDKAACEVEEGRVLGHAACGIEGAKQGRRDDGGHPLSHAEKEWRLCKFRHVLMRVTGGCEVGMKGGGFEFQTRPVQRLTPHVQSNLHAGAINSSVLEQVWKQRCVSTTPPMPPCPPAIGGLESKMAKTMQRRIKFVTPLVGRTSWKRACVRDSDIALALLRVLCSVFNCQALAMLRWPCDRSLPTQRD